MVMNDYLHDTIAELFDFAANNFEPIRGCGYAVRKRKFGGHI